MTTAPVQTRTGPLPTPLAEDVRHLAAAAATHDGVPPLSEQPLLWLTGGGATHLLVVEDGTLLAYGQVDLRDPTQASGEVVVHPARRRRGLGTALLRAARAAVLDAAPTGDALLSVWAHGDLPPARALAAHLHLPATRELWQMRRPLDPTAPPSDALPPAGVHVRAFVPGRDEEAWLRVNARAFAHHPEQGRMTRTDLDDRMAEPWFDPAGLLLAEQDGRLLASGWTKVVPGEDAGEIYALGVDPDAQGRGLGRLLTALMLDHLSARGLPEVLLYTEGDNTPAIAVYRAAGFARSAVDVVYAVGSAL